MKIYAIADLHLSNHESVDKPMRVFGEGWENYEERLRQAWCERVAEDDLVILAGDLSWGLRLEEARADLDWIHALPGQKILLKGNHDLWWNRISYLNTLYEDMFFLQNTCYVTRDGRIAIAGSRGWIHPGSEEWTEHDAKIYRRELGRLEMSLKEARKSGAERIIVCMHYPPADDRLRQSEFTDLLEAYGAEICVYGHLHGMQSFGRGIKGTHRGVSYYLTSLDYLGAIPKLIFEQE
ncbi:MAG: metallophosphoesterase [Mogibacterium sp.]|nr:metallophosphoesterase [Mogibacterium sp.]